MKKKLRAIKYAILRKKLQTQILFSKEVKLIIGSAQISYPNWIESDKNTLDICNYHDFKKVLNGKKINILLAEHVLEHIELDDLQLALKNIYQFLESGGCFRIAVPDGLHPDPNYIKNVQIGCDDHKHLFDYQQLSDLLTHNGFRPRLIEYWDQHQSFHTVYKDQDGFGHIRRSFINDDRNSNGNPNYTSLIIDAIK